jgi:hypothetical protein
MYANNIKHNKYYIVRTNSSKVKSEDRRKGDKIVTSNVHINDRSLSYLGAGTQ